MEGKEGGKREESGLPGGGENGENGFEDFLKQLSIDYTVESLLPSKAFSYDAHFSTRLCFIKLVLIEV